MTLRIFLMNNNPANLVIAAFLALFFNMVMRVVISGFKQKIVTDYSRNDDTAPEN